MYHGVARVCTMVLLGYAPHNIEHSVTHTSKRRQKVYQSPVLGNKHTNVTRERGLGVPGLPRCHCIPTFGKEYVFSLTSHTHHRIKEYGPTATTKLSPHAAIESRLDQSDCSYCHGRKVFRECQHLIIPNYVVKLLANNSSAGARPNPSSICKGYGL